MSDICDVCGLQTTYGSCGHETCLNDTGGYDCPTCLHSRLAKMQAVVDAARELDKSRGTSPDVVGENDHGDSLSAEGMAAVKFHKALASLDQDK